MTDLAKAWQELDWSSGDDVGFVRIRLTTDSEAPLYAGRRRSDGFEALLLDVATARLPAGFELPRADGLDIGATVVKTGPSGRTCLYLALADERYRDVFLVLCSDVLEFIRNAPDDTDSVKRFVSQLERWQSFLRAHGPEGLGPEAQRGLFGELWLLRGLLEEGIPTSILVSRWRGPDRDAHDFQLPAGSIEVKTTAAATPKAIRITNVKQLDDRGLPRLALFLLVVEESANAEISLPELIGQLRKAIDGACRDQFEEALLRVGYADAQFVQNPRRYTVRDGRWFEVTEGFPRLLEPDLPAGVVDVAYAISLGSCAQFQRPAEEMIPVFLKEGAS